MMIMFNILRYFETEMCVGVDVVCFWCHCDTNNNVMILSTFQKQSVT